MERGSKRKSGRGFEDEPAAKRFKSANGPLPVDAIASLTGETPETATEQGLRFVQHLRAARDKNNRTIADAFVELPDHNVIPEYYQDILLPVSISTIEAKLHARQYPSVTAVEADTKRMVSNAKQFNDPQSLIHADAERVRKTTSNWMTKNNPAYKIIEGHSTQPTPLPELVSGIPIDTRTPRSANRVRRRTSPHPIEEPLGKSRRASSMGGNAAPEPVPQGEFSGLTFQQAQEKLLDDLINYREQAEDDFDYFGIFQNLPPRSLTDYYQLIKQPTSLRGVEKKVKGVKGRDAPTGVTEIKTWDALEADMKKIWENARLYNEDGSDIYDLAGELEKLFQEKITAARQQVPEPSQPHLKLNLSGKAHPGPSLKIRLGSASAKDSPDPLSATKSASPAPNSAGGINVDQAALQRQKALVQQGSSYNNRSPALNGVSAAGGLAGRSSLVNGFKPEHHNAATLAQMGSVLANRPQALMGNLTPGAGAAARIVDSPLPLPVQSTPQPYVPQPPPQAEWEIKWRPEGKGVDDALLQSIKVTTHPDLHIPQPFSYAIRPKELLAQQSFAFHVPPSSYKLRLEVGLHSSLTATSGTPRPYKIFCTHNTSRLPSIRPPNSSSLFFDLTLAPANRTEIECVAATHARGTGKAQGDLEREKTSIFIHLIGLHA